MGRGEKCDALKDIERVRRAHLGRDLRHGRRGDGGARFATDHSLTASRFTAIGAFSEAVLGYFDWESKDYQRLAINEQVEVLALLGDIALQGRQSKVHAHVVIGMRDGSARGGHLLSAKVRPTLEVILTESPSHLQRVFDPESGLPLIRL